MIIKLGECVAVSAENITSLDSALATPEIDELFAKFAKELKKVAPKANDFLYFTAVMMHSAERALLDDDGNPRKDAAGNIVTAHWEKKGKSMKWVCSDPSIKSYANNNRDIFPEEELIKAHKKWIGKPLCLDHKSSSVDMIRGLIVDAFYDFPQKRIIALCALDKKNYPDLARKVTTGYAASVSMGTGVGTAICTDCGKCASVEADFCNHMKNKTCYGEINTDLNPIELSIVVSPADPRARIRRIVASANLLSKYVDAKELEIKKTAHPSSYLDEIEEELKKIMDRISDLKSDLKSSDEKNEDTNDFNSTEENKDSNDEDENDFLNDEDDSQSEKETEESQNKTASVSGDDITIKMLSEKLDTISNKVAQILISKKDSMTKSNKKEAFYLGTEEPTPGKPQYAKEDDESIRNKDDKQMSGQGPFPGVGDVTKMYPGYESFGESEEDRKRRLRRLAEEEQRSLRRQAALDKIKKNSFYLGTEEPAPGKVKYTPDDQENVRNKEDAQMRGQSPFPGVGDVDGLHPSPESADEKNELTRKEKYKRAGKLRASFVKAANADGSLNEGKSAWQVFKDDKLVLTASVNDLSGGRSYSLIATAGFGESLLKNVQSKGVQKVAEELNAGIKTAQMAPPAMPAMPAMPEMPAMDEAPAPDAGGDGDPSKNLDEAIDAAEGALSDVRKGVEVLRDQSGNELDKMDGTEPGLTPVTASMLRNEKKLRAFILTGMKKAARDLDTVIDEMKLARQIKREPQKLATASVRKEYNKIVAESVDTAAKNVADANWLMSSFTNYAKGTQKAMKRISRDLSIYKMAQMDPNFKSLTDKWISQHPEDPNDPLNPNAGDTVNPWVADPYKTAPKVTAKDFVGDPNKPSGGLDMGAGKGNPATKFAPLFDPADADNKGTGAAFNSKSVSNQGEPGKSIAPQKGKSEPQAYQFDMGSAKDKDMDKDVEKDDKNDAKMLLDGTIEGTSKEIKEINASFDTSTKAGRDAWRAELSKKAEKALQYAKMLTDAHGKGGVLQDSVKDAKPSGDLGKVESLEEIQKAMMAAVSPATKKKAAEIQRMVAEGQISADRVDGLAAYAVDKEAIAYWKAYYGQAKDKESKEYSSELVAEHARQKKAEEDKALEVKISRAYDLAYQMANKGCIENNPLSIKEEAASLTRLDDNGFNRIAKMVGGMKTATASAIPQVTGNSIFSDPNSLVSTASKGGYQSVEGDLKAQFAQLFTKKRY